MAVKFIRKMFSKSSSSRWKGMLILLIVFALCLCFFPDNNVFTWMAARREIRQQEKQMREYKREILQMDARIKELSSNKDTLEQFAREHFHFAESGEDIYLIED